MKITIARLRSLPGLDDIFLDDLEQIIGSEPIEFRAAMERYLWDHSEQANNVVSAAMALCFADKLPRDWLWDIVRMAIARVPEVYTMTDVSVYVHDIVRLPQESNLRHYAQTLGPDNWRGVYNTFMWARASPANMAPFCEHTKFMNFSHSCTYAAEAVLSTSDAVGMDDGFCITEYAGHVASSVLDSIEFSVRAGSDATSTDVNAQIIDVCCKALGENNQLEKGDEHER